MAAKNPDIRNGVVRVSVKNVGNVQVVAFPGTGEGSSMVGAFFAWVINALYLPVARKHIGWFAQLASVYLPLRRHLSKDKRVLVVGYSQGAALALLLCDHLRRKGFDVEVCAFAAPKPFRFLYRPELKGVIYRYGMDLVTFLPPVTLFYKHGLEVTRIGPKRFFFSIKDHFPNNYKNAIVQLES